MNMYKGNRIYFGDLHNHTGYSDGKLTPFEAFRHAKEEGNLDFLAVTDHAASVDTEKFRKTLEAANQCSTDTFLAIGGCENGFDDTYQNEYGIPVVNGGELLTFGADHTCSDGKGLDDIIENLINENTSFAGFAHPQEAGWPTERLWNGYDMANHRSSAVLNFIKMIEVSNETSAYNLIHEKLYPTALDLGFHVSPIGVSDTHQANWGSSDLDARTAVLAEELTESSIFDALKNQHCYATETGNTQVHFSINGVGMGGTMAETNQYNIHIAVCEPEKEKKEKKICAVEILSDYGNTVWSISIDHFEWETELLLHSSTARYFFVRMKNAEGKRIWSAPIWTGRECDGEIEQKPIHKLEKESFLAVTQSGTKQAVKLCNNDPNDCCRFESSGGYVVIDMGEEKEICAVGYHRHKIPYEDAEQIHALLNRYRYEGSMDGKNYTILAEGVIQNYGSEQIHRFAPIVSRYIKINVLSCVGSDHGFLNSKAAIGEISIFQPDL